MRRLLTSRFVASLLSLSIIMVAANSLAATIDMQALMQFEKILGIKGNKDISYGDLKAEANQRITISPDGQITAENGEILRASTGSHPGKVVIDDGREQQFNFLTNSYTPTGQIRPLKAYCSFGSVKDISCDNLGSVKDKDERTVYLGMVIQVLNTKNREKNDSSQAAFDLSVVYH